MLNKKIAGIVFCCVLASCSEKVPVLDYVAELGFRTTDTLFMKDRVADIDFLPLGMEEDAVFAKPDKVVFKNDRIYILDVRYRRIIVYDAATGNVDFVINRRGRGPGEYLEIRNFAVDCENVYTVDNYTGKVNV